jgi:hypothetical protein
MATFFVAFDLCSYWLSNFKTIDLQHNFKPVAFDLDEVKRLMPIQSHKKKRIAWFKKLTVL